MPARKSREKFQVTEEVLMLMLRYFGNRRAALCRATESDAHGQLAATTMTRRRALPLGGQRCRIVGSTGLQCFQERSQN